MTQQIASNGTPRINLEDPIDIARWLGQYGCTEEQLRAAVKAAGPLAQDVREHIATQAKEAIKRAA